MAPNRCTIGGETDRRNLRLHDYLMMNKLGSGTFGVVYKVKHLPTNKFFAVKMFCEKCATPEQCREILNEVDALESLVSPKVVRLEEYFSVGRRDYIVLEYISEDLKYVLDWYYFEEDRARLIIRDILVGLRFIHSRGWCHNDIKPGNILIDRDGDFDFGVIADFGLAKYVRNSYGNEERGHFGGTIMYMSPAQMRHEESLGSKNDVYSTGIVAYELLCTDFPFSINSDDMLREKEQLDTDIERQIHLSEEAKEVVSLMLEPIEARRPPASVLLNKQWFKRGAK